MTWGKVYFLSFSIIIAAFIVGFAINPIRHTEEPPLAEQLPRPFRPRPRPPEPAPAPLDEADGKLFARLRGHIENVAEERAGRRVEAALQEVADKLEVANPESGVILSTEPSQFIGTSLIVGAIIKVVWKIVKLAVQALIVSAVVALFWLYWPWIIGVFTAAVTIIAWPAGWAAGKVGGKKS